MWSDERYAPFLLQAKPGRLTEEWFRWFVRAWNVARTIKDGRQGLVREYLDRDFRKALLKGDQAEAVDAAMKHIQQRGWSSKKRGSARAWLPISLVSKVGFFLCPTKLVPVDGYAKRGLNNLRRANGAGQLKGPSYSEYLGAFNEHYAMMEPQLVAALNEPWVIVVANKLGCPGEALSTIAMRRKLLDDYLMHSGDYLV
jgi:hypothetical protein